MENRNTADESCECTCVRTIEQRLTLYAKHESSNTIYADALKEIKRLKKVVKLLQGL